MAVASAWITLSPIDPTLRHQENIWGIVGPTGTRTMVATLGTRLANVTTTLLVAIAARRTVIRTDGITGTGGTAAALPHRVVDATLPITGAVGAIPAALPGGAAHLHEAGTMIRPLRRTLQMLLVGNAWASHALSPPMVCKLSRARVKGKRSKKLTGKKKRFLFRGRRFPSSLHFHSLQIHEDPRLEPPLFNIAKKVSSYRRQMFSSTHSRCRCPSPTIILQVPRIFYPDTPAPICVLRMSQEVA